MDTFGPSWSRERIGGPVLKEREKEREGGPRACPVSLSVGQLYQTDWYDRLPIKWKPATCYFPDTLLIAAEGRSASFSPHPSSLANLRTRNKVFTPCRGAGKAWTEIAGTFDIRISSTDKSRKIVTFFRFHLIFISLNGYSWKGIMWRENFSKGRKYAIANRSRCF